MFFLYKLSEIKINLRSIKRHTIKNTERSSHVKYLLRFSNFHETWIFSTDFQKIQKYRISWTSVQWEQSCSMQTDRHDDTNTWFTQFWHSAQKLPQCTNILSISVLTQVTTHQINCRDKYLWTSGQNHKGNESSLYQETTPEFAAN